MTPTWESDLDVLNLPGYAEAVSLDQMPSPPQKHRPFSFIVNSHDSLQKGEHWMAVCFPPSHSRKVLFIEPYGLPMHKTSKHLSEYLSKYATYTETLPFGIQPFWRSQACGHFCVYILAKLPDYNYNLSKLCHYEFSPADRAFNQNKVLRWWHSNKQTLSTPNRLERL